MNGRPNETRLRASRRRAAVLARLVLVVVLLALTIASAGPSGAAGLAGPMWSVSSPALGATGVQYSWAFRQAKSTTMSQATVSVPAGTTGPDRYVAIPATGSQGVSTPDSAANSITGDIDIRVRARESDWTPPVARYLLTKYAWTTQQSYALVVEPSGNLRLRWAETVAGTHFYHDSLNLGLADGSTAWLRATLDVDNGAGGKTVRFYTSTDGNTWNQLGPSITTGGTTSIADGTRGVDLGPGSSAGSIYKMELRNGIDGPVVSRMDPNEAPVPATSAWTASTGETWSLGRAGSDPADIASDLNVQSVSGLPAGGTAQLRMIDRVARYRPASPVSLPAGTLVGLNLAGFTNTAASGAHTSTITTFDNSSPPFVVDSSPTNNVVDFGAQPGSPSWSSSSSLAGGVSSHTWSMQTTRTGTASQLNATVPAGTNATSSAHLSLPGTANNFATTPDTPANSITGTIDIRAQLSGVTWTGSDKRILSKWTDTQRSYALGINTAGAPYLTWSGDGTNGNTPTASASVPFATNANGWVRVVFQPNNGSGGRTATYYTSVNGTGWSQLGTPQTLAGTVSMFDSTTPVRIGLSDTSYGMFAGKVHYAEVRNGNNGTVVNRFDPNQAVAPFQSWTASTGEAWTMNRSQVGQTATLAKDLTVQAVSGVPSGGGAVIDLTDSVVRYRFAPQSVSAATNVMLTVNDVMSPSAGTYTSTLSTLDAAGAGLDGAVTTPLSFTGTRSAPVGWARTSNLTQAPAQYSWSTSAQHTTKLSALSMTVPNGTSANDRYLALSGDTNNFARSTLDLSSAGNEVDIRARLRPQSWNAAKNDQFLVSVVDGWSFYITPTGYLRVGWMQGHGYSALMESGMPVPFTSGSPGWVRTVTLSSNGANSTAMFYWSADGSTWTALGGLRTASPSMPTFTSHVARVGTDIGGGSPTTGNIEKVEIRKDSGGPLLASFDPNDSHASSPTTWASAVTGETWAVNRSGSNPADISAPLTVDSTGGIPTGGAAVLRAIDSKVTYSMAATQVAASTPLSISLSGLRNTPTPGTYASTLSTYDSSPTPLAADTGTSALSRITTAPVATNDVVTVLEDTPTALSVLSNDSDADGSLVPSSVTLVSGVAHGHTSLDPATGSVTYSPARDWFGTDTFTYRVADNDGAVSNTATVDITVTPVNDLPVAVADSVNTPEDTDVTVPVLANDSDVDGTLLPSSVVVASAPSHGATSVDPATGVITYRPEPDRSGTDTFVYSVNDNDGGAATGTVTVNVSSVNDAPVATGDSATTAEDVAVTVPVLANDSDADGTLVATSVEVISGPSHGITAVDPSTGAVTFTPSPNWFGTALFTYRVADNDGAWSGPAVMTVTVIPVNDAPVAVDDTVTTMEDSSVSMVVAANDIDVEQDIDPTSVILIDGPDNGRAEVAVGTGEILYTPSANFEGIDTFTYRVRDGAGAVSNPAIVSVTVLPVNDAPLTANDVATTPEDGMVDIDILGNDFDVEEALSISGVSITRAPVNGNVTVVGGKVRYSPFVNVFGTDNFGYRVCDTSSLCAEGNVDVSIDAVNDAPNVAPDNVRVVGGQSVVVPVLANDHDVDPGDSLRPESLGLLSTPRMGKASVRTTTGSIVYTAAPSARGVDTVTYRACDGAGECGTARLTVDVSPAPVVTGLPSTKTAPVASKGVPVEPPTSKRDADTSVRGQSEAAAFGEDVLAPPGAPAIVPGQKTFSKTSPVVSVIREGDVPTSLLTALPNARFTLASGRLPPGISLGPDGRFSGKATKAGTYRTSVLACNDTECDVFDLKLIVDSSRPKWWPWAGLAITIALVISGGWLSLRVRRRP